MPRVGNNRGVFVAGAAWSVAISLAISWLVMQLLWLREEFDRAQAKSTPTSWLTRLLHPVQERWSSPPRRGTPKSREQGDDAAMNADAASTIVAVDESVAFVCDEDAHAECEVEQCLDTPPSAMYLAESVAHISDDEDDAELVAFLTPSATEASARIGGLPNTEAVIQASLTPQDAQNISFAEEVPPCSSEDPPNVLCEAQLELTQRSTSVEDAEIDRRIERRSKKTRGGAKT